MSGIIEAIGILNALLTAAINLQAQAQRVSDLIQKAQTEGRDLTAEELDQLRAERLAARDEALRA